MKEKNVIVYTQPGWHFCELEKAWLSQQEISFTERNITEDPAALEALQGLGVFSTPATQIDGELVVGFDRKKLEGLLGLSEEGKRA